MINIQTMWLDIKKVYDSVNQVKLLETLIRIKAPKPIISFFRLAIQKWKTNIIYKGDNIGEAKINRGILQGGFLSSILFVIAIQPLSEAFNKEDIPHIEVPTENDTIKLNHLLYVDDIKFFAKDTYNMDKLLELTKNVLSEIDLSIEVAKSARSPYDEIYDDIKPLQLEKAYKYLGIREYNDSSEAPENFRNLLDKIENRARSLCKTRLNARNLILGLDEYALSLINYNSGLIEITEERSRIID